MIWGRHQVGDMRLDSARFPPACGVTGRVALAAISRIRTRNYIYSLRSPTGISIFVRIVSIYWGRKPMGRNPHCRNWNEEGCQNGGDPKLLDDGGEIPKSQRKGWRFDSRVWKLLLTWHKTCLVVNCLLCFDVGLLDFFLKKNKN